MTYEEYKKSKHKQSDTTGTVNSSTPKMSYAEYRKKTATQKVADFNTSAQKYFSDYQSFANSAVSDSQNIGYHNATSMLEKRIQTAADLRKRADALVTSLETSGDILSGDYSNIITQISSTKKGVDGIMDFFGGRARDYSNWNTEDDYNAYLAEQEKRNEYSNKSYTELQKIIGGLSDGAEKEWLVDYADTKKTKDDWEKELSYSKAELTYLRQLQSERDRLTEFQGMATATPEYYDLKKRWEIYHNQFDNLDERIDALEKNIWSLERDVKYKFLNQNEDYAELSTPQDHASMVYRMVNDPSLTKKMDVGTDIGQKSKNGFIEAVAGVVDDFTFDNLQHMTNDERSTFNYIYEKEGKSAAKEYLEYLESALNERSMDQRLKTVSDLTQSVPVFSQTAASLLSVPLKLKGGVSGMIDATGQKIRNDITGENKPIDYNTDAMFFSKAASTIRGTVARNIVDATGSIDLDEEDHPVLSRLLNGKSLADVYQLGMSMVDSAAVAGMALINPALGKAGTVMLGGAAGTQAMLDAVERGASDDQALAMGILSGFFEMFFEKYSLETLLNSNGRRFIDKVWRQAVAEGSEEFFTSAANNVADMIVMAEKSGYMKNVADYVASGMSESKAMQQAFLDMGVDMGWDLVGGLISGGIMGGGSKVASASVQQLQNYKTGKNILSTDGGVDALLYSADQVRSVSPIQTQNALANQIDKVNQKPTARNVGQLNATVQAANNQANTSTNPSDVAKRLSSKGVSSEKVDGIAEAVSARLNGQELTRTQKYILSSALDSPTVQSVISELMKKKSNGIDSTLKNAYDEINTIGGNENGRETALWDLQNQRADGSLPGSQDQTRAAIGDGSGVPGTLGENDRTFHETLPAARRGVTSAIDVFSDDDYATVKGGSSLHQVQNTFRQEYGIECHVIKDSSWTRSSPAYSRDGVVYIREGIDLGTLSTAVPHEATHVMKQQSFQPYVDFILRTPDMLNFQSEVIQKLLDRVADHKKIDPFDASPQQLFSFYDELNAVVYGLYKSGVLDNNEFDYHEYIPGAFNDFASYIQAIDRLHEEFRNQRNASGQTKAADGGVDALMNLANKNDLIQKKSHGVDSAQKRVYDDSNIRDGIPNEESTELQNLSDQGIDAFSNHDNGTVIDGAALQQFQNAFSEEIHEGGASVPRPTWRQSELDAVADFPEYKAQKSFMNGKEVPYGTKGSVRPDYYKSGFSVDIKNYNVESTSSRSNLARNIETQYSQRIENLPDGTKQAVLIDVRGQKVSISALLVLYNDIIQRTNKGVEVLFKMN